MSGKTALHSGAFNFLSFISNGVDPRTGQYGLSIALAVLRGDYLGGAEFPLKLSYNSMGAGDFGYGQGWDINLSSFIEDAYPAGGGHFRSIPVSDLQWMAWKVSARKSWTLSIFTRMAMGCIGSSTRTPL
ncbi:TPA: hypothetical protein ACKP0L_005014 [Pseudomonas putida]